MTELKQLTYGIVGLGIMGGSIAKSVRANVLDIPGASGKIFACDINMQTLNMAENGGVIDRLFLPRDADKMLLCCDIVYVCLYPHATLDFMKEHRNFFKSGSVVTDISGVKTLLVENVKNSLRDDVDFVIGHPMAGGAKEGYVNSDSTYFEGRNYILMPQTWNKKESLVLIKDLITAMGFSHIVETDYHSHDHKIAFTSQLCHVIAAALVESAEDENITEFGGGSFEDLTRIAMINAPLWTELFLSNKAELLGHIMNFERQLDIIKKYIESNDAEVLEKYLTDVRRRRMSMGTFVTRETGCC
ncbi:MAG: prephenate dehydrogenase [Treponema sp.]